jgi:hypothetical protein
VLTPEQNAHSFTEGSGHFSTLESAVANASAAKEFSEHYFARSHLTFRHHSAARVKLRVNVFRVLLSGGGRNIQFSTLMMPGRS